MEATKYKDQASNEDRLRWLIREFADPKFEGIANMLAICFAPQADAIIAEYDRTQEEHGLEERER